MNSVPDKVACRNPWDFTLDEAVAVAEWEIAQDPARAQWSDALDLLGPEPIPEGAGIDFRAEAAAATWTCPHCGADVGWGVGLCCLRCGQVVVPF
jgi:hypothetical protein